MFRSVFLISTLAILCDQQLVNSQFIQSVPTKNSLNTISSLISDAYPLLEYVKLYADDSSRRQNLADVELKSISVEQYLQSDDWFAELGHDLTFDYSMQKLISAVRKTETIFDSYLQYKQKFSRYAEKNEFPNASYEGYLHDVFRTGLYGVAELLDDVNPIIAPTYSAFPSFSLTHAIVANILLGCRPWNLSLISVVVLGLSNMLLTFLLLQSETCGRSSSLARLLADAEGNDEAVSVEDSSPAGGPCVAPTTQERSQPEPDDSAALLELDIRLGRWDSRRLYRMFDSVLTGSRFVELSQSSRVCLATQTSLEKLSSLVQVVHQWSGSVSVALYAAGDEEFEVLQRYLEYMRRCYEPVRERVTFSLAVPRNRPPRSQPRYYPPAEAHDCQKPEGTLNQMTRAISSEQTNWRIRNVYPQNHMRNLARKNCQTDYVFLTDVDIVPSSNLSRVLDEFLAQDKCEKCAYVVPTYELDARVRFPQNKSELIRLARKGLARPFHQKVFIHNQFATNFTRWMLDVTPGHKAQENLKTGKAYVSHDVTNFEFLYEPFYVARDHVPPHDERFMGYGYTRNTQVYEMYVAGYKFKVLSPTFTVHWGLQTRKSRPAWRERQNSVNRKHFEIFKKEVFARYMRDPLKMLKNPN